MLCFIKIYHNFAYITKLLPNCCDINESQINKNNESLNVYHTINWLYNSHYR